MNYKIIQNQFNKIYSCFKTTTEPFDSLEWDGEILEVWNKDKIVETYKYKDFRNFI